MVINTDKKFNKSSRKKPKVPCIVCIVFDNTQHLVGIGS